MMCAVVAGREYFSASGVKNGHMKSRIPPMHTLKALDAFARLGTVRAAAEELGVTRSAISHRLSMLEDLLGFEVLKRCGKGIALTPRASRYAQDVHKSLTLLASAQQTSDSLVIEGTLRVCSTAGFAAMWLCGHIAAFHKEFPHIHLDITTSRELDDVSAGDMDLFIAFGDGNWPNYVVKHLYDVEFMPMCSPTLLNTVGGLNQPGDVLRLGMLHLRRWDDWARWLTINDVEFPSRSAGITFSDLNLVQSAAIAGQGIMMGDELTCSGALGRGQLVAPFATKIKSTGGYYLVSERRKPATPAVTVFIRWLDALIAGALQATGA
jgi:LysR family transcriptional regulator, glycine cleavage system transcriptional activator